jgi:membrane protease YdiL (CAAX protease family)
METTLFTYCILFIIFSTYFLISFLFKQLAIHNIEKALFVKNGLMFLNLKHSIGILLFGLVFWSYKPDFVKELISIDFSNSVAVISGLIILILTIILSKTSVKKVIANYQSVSKIYSGNRTVYFVLRTLFLLAYEIFFRGVLLFTLIDTFGLMPAVVMCTMLYVLIHAFDSKAEILGAIPFGIVLCLLSYFTQSILLPFIIHLSLSLVYEISLFNFLTFKIKKL